MNKLEINTEKGVYMLNGKPIDYATEIDIKITAENPPEAKITTICELDVALEDCDLTEQHSDEDEKDIDAKVDNLILRICGSIEKFLDNPNPIDESATANMVSSLAKLLKVRKDFDGNNFAQKTYSKLAKEIDRGAF